MRLHHEASTSWQTNQYDPKRLPYSLILPPEFEQPKTEPKPKQNGLKPRPIRK